MASDRDLLIAAIITLDSWKYYLLARNRRAIKRMKKIPPELLGFMSEEDFKIMRRISKNHTTSAMLVITVTLGWKVLKIWTQYYPELWRLTAYYGTTLTSRAAWFFAFDVFFNQAVDSTIIFILSVLSTRRLNNVTSPLLTLIEMMLEVIGPALMSGLCAVFLTELTDKYGPEIFLNLTVLSNIIGVMVLLLHVGYIVPFISKPLQDDELGLSIKNLALRVGYAPNKIYIDSNDSAMPNAYFAGLLGTRMIMITESLMTLLEPQQITSVIAHELGHWYYNHSAAQFAVSLFISVGFGYMSMRAYGNLRINQLFSIANDMTHPIIPVYLAIYSIWPVLQDCAKGALSVMGRWCEFSADDFACNYGLSRSLRSALLTMEAHTKNLPLFDGWFSTWFLAHPTILERVRRIDSREVQFAVDQST